MKMQSPLEDNNSRIGTFNRQSIVRDLRPGKEVPCPI